MRFACPHCNAHLQADASLAGKTIKCPACAGKLTIPDTLADTQQHGLPGAPGDSGPVAQGAAPPAGPETGPVGGGVPQESTQLETSAAKWADYANVPLWKSLLIGIGITFLWYLIMMLAKDSYLGVLFLDRGWVQYVSTGLMGWSLGILILKFFKIRKQRAAMLLDILPRDIAEEITPENLPEFHQHVVNLPERVRDSFMVNRVRRGLEYFWIRRNNPEVAAMMSSQSDIDANSISGSFSIIKVFIWAIPIMGFIGTVIGIGSAIGAFAGALSAADDPAMLMGSLTQVTGGLGVAFDTTLLALVLSLIVSFPASAMQKSEEDLLNQVDDYCNENLLKRLNDGGAGGGIAGDSGDLVRRLGDAISRNQKEMMDRFRTIHENTASAQAEQITAFKSASQTLEKQIQDIETRAKQHQMLIDENFTRLIDGVQRDALKSIGALGDGIAGLNSVLKELGERQIVIEKRGWFSRKKT